MPDDARQYKSVDKFDQVFGSLHGKPDMIETQPSNRVTLTPLIEGAQTFIVQTLRQKDEGDTIFIQYMDCDGSFRMVIPPSVADLIARQRDALTTKNRKLAAREQARIRKAAGIRPAFLNGKHKKKPAKKTATPEN